MAESPCRRGANGSPNFDLGGGLCVRKRVSAYHINKVTGTKAQASIE